MVLQAADRDEIKLCRDANFSAMFAFSVSAIEGPVYVVTAFSNVAKLAGIS